MKIGYYRTDCEGNSYIIPENKVKEFGELDWEISTRASCTDQWYDLIDKFHTLYDQYIVEDELCKYKIIMDERCEE